MVKSKKITSVMIETKDIELSPEGYPDKQVQFNEKTVELHIG